MDKPLYVVGAGMTDDPEYPVILDISDDPTGAKFDTITAAMSSAQARTVAGVLLKIADMADEKARAR